MKKISMASLVILMIAAIDNIRNLPTAALFGSSLIFFFSLSACFFLIPTALVAAELSAAFPEKGGVYQWVQMAFGKRWAMVAIWLQWINTMVWYPTMLLFISGTFAYLIDPNLVHNKAYLISMVLTIFWSLTFVNLRGLHISALVNNICCIAGMMVPLLVLIVFGAIWFFSGKPLQITLSYDQIIPPLGDATSWVSLIAIMASFLGMELSGVHVNDIQNPQRNFPKAVLMAASFIFLSMVLGSLAIAFVLPAKEINLVSGVMQLFTSFFKSFGLEGLTPVMTLLIAFGSIGTMINWLISPAKGLMHAAEYKFLPEIFAKKNQYGVPTAILLGQAVLVSLVCLLFLLEPSINGFYWFLTALSTELYMLMYVLMFAAALKLHYRYKERSAAFKIPGKSFGIWLVSAFGLLGCLATIAVSFFPPENVDIGTPGRYVYLICAGNLLTLTPLIGFFLYHKKKGATYGTQVAIKS
jgi:amino acid transporter